MTRGRGQLLSALVAALVLLVGLGCSPSQAYAASATNRSTQVHRNVERVAAAYTYDSVHEDLARTHSSATGMRSGDTETATLAPEIAAGPGPEVATRFATEESTLVIGRGADLAKPGALGPGEYKFSWPSKLPDFQAEWKINSGLLRTAMKAGSPIRDASPGDTGGLFLNAERNLLEDRGWTFDAGSGYWMPPP